MRLLEINTNNMRHSINGSYYNSPDAVEEWEVSWVVGEAVAIISRTHYQHNALAIYKLRYRATYTVYSSLQFFELTHTQSSLVCEADVLRL